METETPAVSIVVDDAENQSFLSCKFGALIDLEPIREVSIHDEDLATRRLSMMRIMARWMKAATVLA